MITSLLRRLLGKPSVPKAQRQSALRQKSATIVPVRRHKIDPKLISANAIKVTSTLQQAGYQAYIVGGAVRDLLLNIAPKDFDVATNATPEQVQALFRRARLIGRRFQIVHVVFYTGREQEIIEVSTFRAPVDSQTSTQLNEKTSLRTERRRSLELDTHSHTVDMHGRVLRDNVWGDQAADAARRDFTINAMYYDPADQTVHDYHAGIADIQARVLRIIGDPVTRYREDPIRMLRAVRFAAKTGFTLATETAAPIAQLAALIDDVPAARVFDEMLKLLLSGHAWASLQQLRQAGLHHGLLPLLDVIVEQPGSEHFVQLALANTDARIANNKTVSPGFLFAALFWRQVQSHWQARKNVDETPTQSLYAAMDTVLEQQTQALAIQRRHVGDMKDIWALQPRFERRIGRAPLRLLEAPRFRAGYDFLLLRCQSGELPEALGIWWAQFQSVDMPAREEMLTALRETTGSGVKPARTRRSRRKVTHDNAKPVELE